MYLGCLRHWSRLSNGRLNRDFQSLPLLVEMIDYHNENPTNQNKNLIDQESYHGDLNPPRILREYMNPIRIGSPSCIIFLP